KMLVPAPRTGVNHGQPMVTARLVEQGAAEMQRPRRSAGRHQRIVEALVPLAPFALEVRRILLLWHAELLEQEVRAYDLGLPIIGAVTDRIGERPGFEINTQFGKIEEIGKRDRGHGEAATSLGAGEPFRHKMRQRLAQGADRRAVALAQPAEAQSLI